MEKCAGRKSDGGKSIKALEGAGKPIAGASPKPAAGSQLPLISIIVPVYNVKEYLPRCVDSLQKQTYPQLEILLVDDGSEDGTSRLCDDFAAGDGRIRVFHKANGGSSSARNLGIRNARGEYLGFVDSDDYVDADMYEKLMDAILKYGIKAAQIGRDELDPQGKALPDICIPPQEIGILSAKDFLRELLLHRGDCSFCTKLICRECFAGHEFPEGRLNEDFRLLVEMLQQLGPLASLPGHAYHVCYRLGSNTRKESRDVFPRVYGDCVDNADWVLELVRNGYLQEPLQPGADPGERKADAELEKVAFRFGVFQRLEYLLHIPIPQMVKGEGQYGEVVSWMRKHLWRSLTNPYLTLKNKSYHVLFAIAPRGIRVLHRRLRG